MYIKKSKSGWRWVTVKCKHASVMTDWEILSRLTQRRRKTNTKLPPCWVDSQLHKQWIIWRNPSTSAPCYLDKLLYRLCRSHLSEALPVQSGAATLTALPPVSCDTQSCDRLYSGVFTSRTVPSRLDSFTFKAHHVQRKISAGRPPLIVVRDCVSVCKHLCVCGSQQRNKRREKITSSEIINVFCFNNLCFHKEYVKLFTLFSHVSTAG